MGFFAVYLSSQLLHTHKILSAILKAIFLIIRREVKQKEQKVISSKGWLKQKTEQFLCSQFSVRFSFSFLLLSVIVKHGKPYSNCCYINEIFWNYSDIFGEDIQNKDDIFKRINGLLVATNTVK